MTFGNCGAHYTISLRRYNLISKGDVITAKTTRKVKSTSSSNMVTVTKKVLSLSLKVASY